MNHIKNADISNKRCVNAPIATVWELWSDPNHLAKWWGPRGFRNTIHKHEFKSGGEWEFIMHGPDGKDYPNTWIYTEIVPMTRIVMDHSVAPKFTATIQFEAVGDRTWIYFDMTFENPDVAEAIKDYAILGNEQNLERLEAALSEKTGVILAKSFVLSRTFNAPVEILWEMWTNPEHMGKWWGPKDAAVGYSKMNFKRGGFYHYALMGSDGNKMWGKMFFKDIVPNKRLMFINAFSNEEGSITRHPMAPGWPLELLSTISFDEKENQTTVTIEWCPVNAFPSEIECFNNGHESMTQGWGGSLDRLESVL